MTEIIIVLGKRDKDTLQKRVDRAISYFNKTLSIKTCEWSPYPLPKKYIIFSGGSSDGKSKPEGSIMMKDYCGDKIDKTCCFVEDKSRDTLENLLFSKEIIEKHFGFGISRITICTSSYHIRRTIILAKLVFNMYNLNFIHTNETVSEEDYIREKYILDKFIDYYVMKNTDQITIEQSSKN